MDYFDMCAAMRQRKVVEFLGDDGKPFSAGVINGITAEDGSGHSWNLRVCPVRGYTDMCEMVWWHDTKHVRNVRVAT